MTTGEHEERPHALFGGSVADIRVNCPGSAVLSKDLPKEPPTIQALQGTEAHEFAEIALKSFLEYKLTGVAVPHLAPSDPVMVAYISQYVDTIWKEVLHESITGKKVFYEEKLTLLEDLAYGYIDFFTIYIDNKGKLCGHIVDFKYGVHEVDAIDNLQLAFYAVCLQKLAIKSGKPLEYIIVSIFQPRISGQSYKPWKITSSQLEKYTEKFDKACDEIFVKKSTKLKAGKHCYWCKAKSICPAYRKVLAKESALTVIDDLTLIDKLPSIDSIPMDVLVNINKHSKEITDYLSSINKYLYNLAYNKKGAPYVKLVEGKSRRIWKKDIDIEEFRERFGDEAIKSSPIARNALEKILPKEKKPLLLEYVQLTQNKPMLVPYSDPREEIENVGVLTEIEDYGEE